MTHRFPHGSRAGYEQGCRSKGACLYDADSEFLTCAEAMIRSRWDYTAAKLPAHQPLPRAGTVRIRIPAPAAAAPKHPTPPAQVHGTPWGYQRGCRESRECPNWRAGRITCSEARSRYVTQNKERRRRGHGTGIQHGTPGGYLLGCRDTCPGDTTGRTCTEARSAHRRALARNTGVNPRTETTDAAKARRRIQAWIAEGLSIRQVAKLTGCGRTTITAIVNPSGTRGMQITRETLHRICHA